MRSTVRYSVSAVLLMTSLIACNGCGGGGEESAPVGASPAPAPAPVGNRAPTISGAPQGAVIADAFYEFRPTTSDADGDSLAFSARNLPPWADLDPVTGRIYGTPQAGDLGAYEDVVLTVSDGHTTASIGPFLISVNPQANASVTVAWDRPMAKVNGSPLDDLGGFRILYGRSEDDLDRSVLVMNPDVTSYRFESIEAGVWYFTVVAVSSGGLEGPRGPTTMKTI
jgi:hypothetical protein